MDKGYCGGCNEYTYTLNTNSVLSCEECGFIYYDDNRTEKEQLEKDIKHWTWMLSQGHTKYGIFDEDVYELLSEAKEELKRF